MKKIYNFPVTLLIVGNMFAKGVGNNKSDPTLKTQAKQWIQSQPVQFLENKGQMTDMEGKPVSFVLFKAEAPGLDMYVTEKGLTYLFTKIEDDASTQPRETNEKEQSALNTAQAPIDEEHNRKIEWSRIDMNLQGANIKKENIIRETPSVTDLNFFYGHCADGIYGVKKYEKITIKNIYHGIDWVLYNSNEKGFKYDFIVHPGSDPKQIELVYSSLNPISITRDGEIEINTGIGTLTENTPLSYQNKLPIKTKFIKTENNKIDRGGYNTHIKFVVEKYNKEELLIIDPQLVWATYFGGTSTISNYTVIRSIDCDLNNNVFVIGSTTCNFNFPLLNPLGGVYFVGTTIGGTGGIDDDAFISKFDNAGQLLWSTYYGGSKRDDGQSISVDLNNNVFVTGRTISSDFPTQNALGTTYFQLPNAGITVWKEDIFILKFNNTGVRIWATCYGGSGGDLAMSICTDPVAGNVFITGQTGSIDFPLLNPGAPTFFQPAGAANFNVNSMKAFILKFNNSGMQVWATITGGPGPFEFSRGYSICSDPVGNIFITGGAFTITGSTTGFPVLNPGAGAYFDANYNANNWKTFIFKFSNTGVLLWGTLYGGQGGLGLGYTIYSDLTGNIFITGITADVSFPVFDPGSGAFFQPIVAGGNDAYILKFSNGGIRLWATLYGGTGQEYQSFGANTYDNIAVDPCNNIYISFHTSSSNAPVQAELFQNTCSPGFYKSTTNNGANTFITKFSNNGTRLWASYFTGDGSSIGNMEALAVDKLGNLFLAGLFYNYSANDYLPLTNPGGSTYYNGNVTSFGVYGYIAKFTPIQATFTQSQVNSTSCTPCNGSATVTVNCGNSNYSYVWSNGSSTLNSTSATNTITGLCSGIYNVTATSNCNQTQIATFSIAGTQCGGCTLTGQFTKGTASCSGCGCKEWILVTASGGTSPYSYSWANGYANRYKNQLCPGNYTINIKDKNGCSVNINLTAP